MTRLVALVAVLGLAGSAAAQAVRFPRRQPPPPPARPAPVATASPLTLPAVDVEPLIGASNLRAIRPEQEPILEGLIRDTPDTEVEEKSDYYFRLAEVEAALHLKWRTADPRKAKAYLLKAIRAYKVLTSTDAFRAFPKLDAALFYYAYTLQLGNYAQEARNVYMDLLKKFPNSTYVPSAYIAFADYFFAQGQLAEAEAAYKKVLEYPRTDAYPYAMMKLGWTQLQAGRARDALDTQLRAVKLTGMPKLADVKRAAEVGFVAAYAQVGKPADALAAFTRVDARDADQMVAMLSAAGGVDVCRAEIATVRAAADRASAVERLMQACPAAAAPLADELARAAHAELARTHTLDAAVAAERLYRLYLDAAPAAPDLAEVRAAYAEVLWAHAELQPAPERWSAAAAAFVAAGEAGAAVLAWKNGFVADTADLDAAARDRKKPRDVPAGEASVLAVLEAGDAESHLLAASRYRFYAQPDRAAPLLSWIVENAPLDPTAEQAAVLLLDSLVRAQQYEAALAWVDRFAADKRFVANKPALQAAIRLMRSRSLRRN